MKKHLTVWRIVCYLFYFLGVCTLVLGVTNARYITTVSGTGTASVAAVALDTTELSGIDEKKVIDLTNTIKGLYPGQSQTITFQVKNFKDLVVSEVTQEYSVIVETTGNLPLTYELSAGDAKNIGTYATTSSTVPESNPTVWQWTGGSLPHSQECTHSYTLTVKWNIGKNDAAFSDEIDLVTLTIDAKQARPGNS